MIIDIQFAHEHLSGVLKLDRIKKLNLDKIESFDELASMPPDEKMRIKNFIYNNVIIVYGVQHNDGIIPESKIKVIAKDNNKRNIWCFAIRDVTPSHSRYRGVKTEYKIFDCSSPIWNREVNQW